MARSLNRLTARGVAALKEPGLHADGGGLYLKIDQAGARRWTFIYHFGGKRREMGLGGADVVSLQQARELADDNRALLAKRLDPLEEKRRAARAGTTFEKVLDDLLADLTGGWKSAKHKAQWRRSVELHAAGLLKKPVADIDTPDVLAALRKVWAKSPAMAKKVRGRIERVLDAAKVQDLRSGENAARWRGHLDKLLPRLAAQVEHYAALPFDDLPDFLMEVRARRAGGAAALELLILTATRTNETLSARWEEFDLVAKVWTIPAARMKSSREHRVPLSEAAMDVLDTLDPRASGYLFPGRDPRKPMSNMSLAMLLRRMKRTDITVHGFRSTFRDWAGERTNFPREIAEAALAHVVGDAVERAYRRGDALEKRRKLMAAWASFCTTPPASNVIPLKA